MRSARQSWRLALLAALALCPAAARADLRINEFLASNRGLVTNAQGRTPDWIEIHNSGPLPVRLDGWHLTDDPFNPSKWTFPAVDLFANGYLLVYADGADTNLILGELHANFSLSAGGEYLALVQPDGVTVAHAFAPKYPPQQENISYGIGPADEPRYFTNATPGRINAGGASDFVADTKFSPDRGFYTHAILVTITSATAGAEIRYTLDGAAPTTASPLYAGPISVSTTTTLRARGFKTGLYPTDVDTHTYIFLADVARQCTNGAPPTAAWPPAGVSVNGQVMDYAMDPAITRDPLYSNRVNDALLAIPTISLVTDLRYLFDAVDGIYVNASVELMERPTSVELIYPDGRVGFQENCGLRIRGGASTADSIPKHGFRLRFRGEYGAPKLEYPIFGEDGPEESNGVDLRCEQFPSFHAQQPAKSNNLRDLFSRDMQLAFDQPSTRGDHYHLYLNGLYWGMYQTQENIEQPCMAENFGGEAEDWDVIAKKKYGGEVEGSDAAYRDLWTATLAGFSGAAGMTNYFRIQGLNADGLTRNPSYTNLLDVENLADFMLGHYWTGEMDGMSGNWGLNNFVCAFNRVNPDGFKYFEYDSEWSLDIGFANNVGPYLMNTNFGAFCAQTLHQKLVANPEYLVAFADRVYLRMFNDGVLTAGNAIAGVRRRAAEIDTAIIAETARWGDALVTPPMTRSNWVAAVAATTNWMVGRPATVLAQLRSVGWYPALDAPVFSQQGGAFTNGFRLGIAGAGSLYYTLDGTDPRQILTGVARGTLYTGTIPLDRSVQVKARATTGTNAWSALASACFVAPGLPALRVTELMYHPRPPEAGQTNWTASDFEFIELRNGGAQPIGLGGLRFDGGIRFDFGGGAVASLEPGAYVLVVRNRAAFAARYPDAADLNIAGEFEQILSFPRTALDDGGERLSVVDALGAPVLHFTYDDDRGWPQAADGAGHSLVPLIQDESQTNGMLDCGGNWRASAFRDGSPGRADPEPPRDLVLNEFMAHTDYDDPAHPDYDSNDWIELFNGSDAPVSLADWYLSDDADNLRKWAVPATNTLAAGAVVAFDEVSGFHAPIASGFGLDKAGEKIFLSYLPAGGVGRVADAVRFKGQSPAASWGRYPDGYAFWRELPPTRAAPNAEPAAGVVITEVMYHPAAGPIEEEDGWCEYVELYNAGATDVNLWNAEAGAWRVDGIGLRFPSNTTLWAGETVLLVGFDPLADAAAMAAFTNRYGPMGGVRFFGPYTGRLADGGERLGVEWGQAGDLPGEGVSWVGVDETSYFDRAPFPAGADGTGLSLTRALGPSPGADPSVWSAEPPTPGLPPAKMAIVAPPRGSVWFAPCSLDIEARVDARQTSGRVRRVEFYENETLLGVAASAPYRYEWSQAMTGAYLLSARLVEDAGVYTARVAQVFVNALDNGAGVTDVTDGATLGGRLRGPASVSTRIYWGSRDGGTDPGAWERVEELGVTAPGDFAAYGAPLDPERTYYYRCHAWSADDATWSAASVSFRAPRVEQWLTRRMRVTFEGYDGAERLTRFPAFIRIGEHLPGFAYADCAADGRDLRFVSGDGADGLPYEIERWDTQGVSAVWVRVPEVAGTNSCVWMHWGNPAARRSAREGDGSVWANGFRGVWHLAGDGADATPNGLHGPLRGDVTGTAGVAGHGLRFGGAASFVGPVLSADWLRANRTNLTVSLWAKPDGPQAGATVFGAHGESWNFRMRTRLDVTQQTNAWAFRVKDASSLIHGAATGAWQHLALAMSSNEWTAYLDGIAAPAQANPAFQPTNAAAIGALYDSGQAVNPFAGALDEVRVSDVPRSGDWLRAEWRNLALHALFNRYGAVWADTDLDGLSDAWESAHFHGLAASDGSGDADRDGLSDAEEQTSGTDPVEASNRLELRIQPADGGVRVWFDTLPADPAVYGELLRCYDLERTTGLRAPWTPVEDYCGIPGDGTTVVYTHAGGREAFFRVRAGLRRAAAR